MEITAMASEMWKPTPGYTGYEVSSLGRVRTYRNANGRGGLTDSPRLMKLHPTPKKPYLRVRLSIGNKGYKDVPVHQLVLLAFVGPRPSDLHDACHHDGNAINNVLSNLRWGTKQDNADDRTRHGTQVKGDTSPRAKLTSEQVKEIKAELPRWKRGMIAYYARKFNVGETTIAQVKTGKTWSHV